MSQLMSQILSQVQTWLDYARQHPAFAVGIVAVAVGFYVVSTWKPRHTRDAESRLREIRDETHDYYRNQRPPGR